ncbi:calcium/sodium antiporter [Senegalia massiliensis]|uniref:Sodium:calcium antiporter n=1 Tax=Senegalia massiliensis TaxID=1720316 RepID=A0A845R3Q4_9CLOT|nr:calcium/sodium antiporter [Senegalia massiliensis]NBI08316.1 sodium:calcium antiporter [Senegalia massiliensis]
MIISIILFILGLILIVKGGDYFIESSVEIAKISKLPKILIGATIVSVATTTPEAIVSITASFKNHTQMSVGNSIGSIICNTGLILGITSIISPTKVKGNLTKLKSLMLIVFFIIFLKLSFDRTINYSDAWILLILLIIYILFDLLVIMYKKNKAMKEYETIYSKKNYIKIILLFIIGIVGIFIGSNLLINNGIVIATFIGIPEAVISLTLIALGTSLPELTTALTALKKGHSSLSIGNIIGANILNISLVLGTSGFLNDLDISIQNIYLDFVIAFILILILTLTCIFRGKVNRLVGFSLFLIYILYLFILYYIYF